MNLNEIYQTIITLMGLSIFTLPIIAIIIVVIIIQKIKKDNRDTEIEIQKEAYKRAIKELEKEKRN